MCVRVTSEAPGGFEEGGVHGAGRDRRGGARLAAARAGTQMKRARVIWEGRRCGQGRGFPYCGVVLCIPSADGDFTEVQPGAEIRGCHQVSGRRGEEVAGGGGRGQRVCKCLKGPYRFPCV